MVIESKKPATLTHKTYTDLVKVKQSLQVAEGVTREIPGQGLSRRFVEFFIPAHALARRLVDFFAERGLSFDSAMEQAGLNKGSARNVGNGHFNLESAERILALIEKNAGHWDTEGDISTERWIDVRDPATQETITTFSGRLSALYKFVKKSKQFGSENSPINGVQKAQLIAMLEAMLLVLRAPFVELNFLSTFVSWLASLGKKSAEKQISKNITDAFGEAVNAGKKTMNEMDSATGLRNLSHLEVLATGQFTAQEET